MGNKRRLKEPLRPFHRSLLEHTDFVTCVSFFSDGKRLVSTGDDLVVRIWDFESGTCIKVLGGSRAPGEEEKLGEVHTKSIKAVCVIPKTNWVATGGFDRLIKVWDDTGACMDLGSHDKEVMCLASSPDGNYLISGGADKMVVIWDLETLLPFRKFEGQHTGTINAVSVASYSEASTRVASGSTDTTVNLWELETGKLLATLEGHSKSVLAVSLSNDALLLATGGADETIQLWSLASAVPSCIYIFDENQGAITALVMCYPWLVSGGQDGTIKFLDVDTGLCLRTLWGHRSAVNSVAISPQGNYLASSGRGEKPIRLWDLETGSCLVQVKVDKIIPGVVALTSDGRLLATGNKDGTLTIWDMDALAMSPTVLDSHQGQVQCLSFSKGPDTLLVSGGLDRTVRLWKLQPLGGYKCVNTITIPGQAVQALAIGRTMFFTGSKDTVRGWSLKKALSGKTMEASDMSLPAHKNVVSAISLSFDDKYIASASQFTVVITKIDTQEVIVLEDHPEWVNSLAFSSSGQHLVTGALDQKVRVFDCESGDCIRTLIGHTHAVKATIFAGPHVVSASDDATIRCWDFEKGMFFRALQGLEGPAVSLASSEDGRLVAAVSADHLCVWDLHQGPSRLELWNNLQLYLNEPQYNEDRVAPTPAGTMYSPGTSTSTVMTRATSASTSSSHFFFRSPSLIGASGKGSSMDFFTMMETHWATLLEPNTCDSSQGRESSSNILHWLIQSGMDGLVCKILADYPETCLVRPSALRKAVQHRSPGVTSAIISTMAELVSQRRLRIEQHFYQALDVRDLVDSMTIFPDIALQGLKPLLGLQAAPGSVAEGCERRIIRHGEFWTAGASTIHPPSFWRDHFSPTRDLVSSVEGMEVRLIKSMSSAFTSMRKFPTKRTTCTVYVSHEPSETGTGGTQQAKGRRSLSGDQPLCNPGDNLSLQRSHHERLGTQVLPYFMGIKGAAGTPYCQDHSVGFTSFLQACVDLSIELQNATVFECEGLIAILDYKWNTFGRYAYTRELCIYVAMLLTFSLSCIIVPHLEKVNWRYLWEVFNLLFIAFFAVREVLQWRTQRSRRYFSDYWNYVDLLSYLMVLSTVIARLAAPNDDASFVIASVALLPLWSKMLYYMRGYRRTGVLVRMVFEILRDTRYFLLVMAFVALGFAQAFHMIFHNQPASGYGSLKMSVLNMLLMCFGATPDLNIFYLAKSYWVAIILYLIFTLLMVILLLNLLVAIMGDSFSRIVSNAILEWRLEQAHIILEVESLMDSTQFQDPVLFPSWIQVLRPAHSMGVGNEEWAGTVSEISLRIQQVQQAIGLSVGQSDKLVQKKLDGLTGRIDRLEKSLDKRLEALDTALTKNTGAYHDQLSRLTSRLEKLDGFMAKMAQLEGGGGGKSSSGGGGWRRPSTSTRLNNNEARPVAHGTDPAERRPNFSKEAYSIEGRHDSCPEEEEEEGDGSKDYHQRQQQQQEEEEEAYHHDEGEESLRLDPVTLHTLTHETSETPTTTRCKREGEGKDQGGGRHHYYHHEEGGEDGYFDESSWY